MKKLSFGILFFTLFFSINTIYCVFSVPQIKKMITTGKEQEAAEAIDARKGSPADLQTLFSAKFGKTYEAALTAKPADKDISTAPPYGTANAAYNAFKATPADKAKAQAFITAYDALDKVKDDYTDTKNIIKSWETLLATAKTLAGVNMAQVMKANQNAATEAMKVVNKMETLVTAGTISDTDADKMATEWKAFTTKIGTLKK